MSFITTLTRMWLTRSIHPFTFVNTYDRILPYEECEQLGLYVHIPFCRKICSFCPYCKEIYTESKCNEYIDALLQEIHIVGGQMSEKKTVTSLYFGGGTPALAVNRIREIIDTLKQYFIITEGIGLELHPDDVTVPTLTTLKNAGITKISIGIQSFQNKYQAILGRTLSNVTTMQNALKQVPFETVSMDLIFALPKQTAKELQNDMETAFEIGANHVAIYPFIDFTFTTSTVPVMKKKEKQQLLYDITNHCRNKGYHRTSIWTFSNSPDAKYSSMTRDNFLGFGCSATSLLKDQFKINTFSVSQYCNRILEKELPTSLTIHFTLRQRMVYYLFWTAYSTKINPEDFSRFFGISLNKMYGLELQLARLLGFARYENNLWQMTDKGAFYYHYYENFYTLSYIDKMWGIMRKEAFPDKITL